MARAAAGRLEQRGGGSIDLIGSQSMCDPPPSPQIAYASAKGELISGSEATVKSVIDGEELLSVGEGNGPVNALDTALRKDLGKYSAYLEDLRLVDFKVRILNQQGTEALTRVLVESANGAGERWFTVGVSTNIVDASFQALLDSITYKLFHDGAPAST